MLRKGVGARACASGRSYPNTPKRIDDIDMADTTPDMVRKLRERTGAGLMECKRALDAAKGDEEVAVDNLRKAGLKTAEKKASREMGEGRVQTWIAPKSR